MQIDASSPIRIQKLQASLKHYKYALSECQAPTWLDKVIAAILCWTWEIRLHSAFDLDAILQAATGEAVYNGHQHAEQRLQE